MNKYWSNDDDQKVNYSIEPPQREPRAEDSRNTPDDSAAAQPPENGAFSYPQKLDMRKPDADPPKQRAAQPLYGADRSSFISGELNAQKNEVKEFTPRPSDLPPENEFTYNDGYQVHSEHPYDAGDGGGHGGFWRKLLIVVLVLAVIGGGAYLFRNEILDLVGQVFGEEVVWKIKPTPAPTEAVPDTPAYIHPEKMDVKPKSMQEITAVMGGMDLNTDTVTDQNVVLANEKPNGTLDYYLFDYDTGRLLGYYEGLDEFIPCGKNIFYIAQEPYLITSRGFPLADMDALRRSAGSDVTIRPMINGWAMVKEQEGAMLNYVGEDGKLISELWFSKAFPFTGETTLAYVDTGNITEGSARYALYLLMRDGTTRRLHYVADTDGVMDSVCGMAFTEDGEMLTQDETLTLVMTTNDVAAYVNCGALTVRDPESGLYGLFVGGVQQYPFLFDSIEPMPSDLLWTSVKNGYITRYAVDSREYPLPLAYSFVLTQGDTVQIISMAAVSAYPMLFD